MNIIKRIDENQMILEFLKAEIDSSRFRKEIDQALNQVNADIEIITKPNLHDQTENQKRKEIFKIYRDYENQEGLFEGFPDDIKWYKAEITKAELLNEVYYIDYSYWNEITDGSRLPKDAVEKIRKDIRIYDVSNEGFINASKDFRNGKKFAKLILVSDRNKIVVLEGHLRITVYAMNTDILPDLMSVIIGFSSNLKSWTSF